MGLIAWIIFGAIVGWISGLMTGRADRVGCLSSIALGVAGTVIGGLVTAPFAGGIMSISSTPLVIGLIVAIILLSLGNALLGTVETTES